MNAGIPGPAIAGHRWLRWSVALGLSVAAGAITRLAFGATGWGDVSPAAGFAGVLVFAPLAWWAEHEEEIGDEVVALHRPLVTAVGRVRAGLSGAAVRRADGDPDGDLIFDAAVRNRTDRTVAMRWFQVRWRYRAGVAGGLDEEAPRDPAAEYVIDLGIDIEDGDRERTLLVAMRPPLLVPPTTAGSHGVVGLTLQLHHTFTGRVGYHPNADWDILFAVDVVDVDGTVVELVAPGSWRWPED